MYTLFKIKFKNANNDDDYEYVVAEKMSEAIECFEDTFEFDPLTCEEVKGFDSHIIVSNK